MSEIEILANLPRLIAATYSDVCYSGSGYQRKVSIFHRVHWFLFTLSNIFRMTWRVHCGRVLVFIPLYLKGLFPKLTLPLRSPRCVNLVRSGQASGTGFERLGPVIGKVAGSAWGTPGVWAPRAPQVGCSGERHQRLRRQGSMKGGLGITTQQIKCKCVGGGGVGYLRLDWRNDMGTVEGTPLHRWKKLKR